MYAAFGTTAEILKRVIDVALAGDDEDVAVAVVDRPLSRWVHEAETAPELLARYAVMMGEVATAPLPSTTCSYEPRTPTRSWLRWVEEFEAQRFTGADLIAQGVVARTKLPKGAGGRSLRPVDQITEPTTELAVEIGAPPTDVWQIVADVTRIPEWSPVCHRCEWIGSAEARVVGARFRGSNRLNGARWSRDCVVTAATPGEVFAFSTLFNGQESTRWRYRFEPTDSGTRVSEAYQIVTMPRWVRVLRRVPGALAKTERDTRRNIETSLTRLKAIAEGRAPA